MTFTGALGVAAVCLLGGSAATAHLAFALAAATVGFMLWNWPVTRYPFGFSALFAGAGSLPLLAGHALLYARASAPALALILLVFLADAPARWVGGGRRVRGLNLVYLTLLCLLPMAAALLVAYAARYGISALRLLGVAGAAR
jgi:hypothetical protein